MSESPPGWDVVVVAVASGTTTPSNARGASSSPSSTAKAEQPVTDTGAGTPSGSGAQGEGEASNPNLVHDDDEAVDSGAVQVSGDPDSNANAANDNATNTTNTNPTSTNVDANFNTNPAPNDDTNVTTNANVTDGTTHTPSDDGERTANMISGDDMNNSAESKTNAGDANPKTKPSRNDSVKELNGVDAEAECSYVDDDTWTKGDMTVISSDGVRFRVPSYQVIGFWPLARARSEASIQVPRVIALTGRKRSDGERVRGFLHLATEGSLPFFCGPAFFRLVRFLKAHKCNLLLQFALCLTRDGQCQGKILPIDTFMARVFALDKPTMRYALEKYDSTWPSDCSSGEATSYSLEKCEYSPSWGSSVFDPFGWPLPLWAITPAELCWALAFSWRKCGASADLVGMFMEKLEEVEWENSDTDTEDTDLASDDDEPSSIVDDDRWKDGDFELITADNVRFRVNSFDLLARSGVFRDIHSLNSYLDLNKTPELKSTKSVTLTDPHFETASTLRNFLELVQKGKLTRLSMGYCQAGELVALAKFLDKFDCTTDIALFKLLIRESFRDNTLANLPTLIVGARLLDLRIIRDSLTNASKKLNPYRMSLYNWKLIRSPCLWALGRAWKQAGLSESLPTEFDKYLKAAKDLVRTALDVDPRNSTAE